MDPRIEQALRAFDETHADVVSFVRACDEREWREVTTIEGWPVGVIAHHIAVGYETAIRWIDHLRRGEAVPGDEESHDAGNARHAAEFSSTTKGQTLADLESGAVRLREYLTTIKVEEMPREAMHGPAGRVISVERMVGATARHPRMHLESMRGAVEGGAERAS